MARDINWGQILPGDYFLSAFFAYLIGFMVQSGWITRPKNSKKLLKPGRAWMPRHRKPEPLDYEDSS